MYICILHKGNRSEEKYPRRENRYDENAKTEVIFIFFLGGWGYYYFFFFFG